MRANRSGVFTGNSREAGVTTNKDYTGDKGNMIELKEHNKRPYEELCKMLEEHDRCAYVSATGTGKSYVIGKYIEEHDLIDKTLMLVPSNAIKKSWQKLLPQIRVITYQTVGKSDIVLHNVELIVCDEMHHLGAKKWGELYQKLIEHFTGKIIGTTATPVRFLDNERDMALEYFEGNLVVGTELPEAIEKRILPSFNYITAMFNRPVKKQSISQITDSLYLSLDILRTQNKIENILRKHLGVDVHKIIVFANSVAEIDGVLSACKTAFPEAEHIIAHTYMKKSETENALKLFTSCQKTAFLYTVDLLNEGAHIDGVDSIIMFRKTKSPIIYLQQIGRALTANCDREKVTIFDFVANHNKLNKNVGDGIGVINWINDTITDKKYQVLVNDYIVEELELLKKIEKCHMGQWIPEEDALILELYADGVGLDKLTTLMPNHSRADIEKRAVKLGFESARAIKKKQYLADIRTYYLDDNGIDKLLKLYPSSNARAITAAANRMGLFRQERGKEWSDKEIEILKQNKNANMEELMKLLPNRSRIAISTRRRKMGLNYKSMTQWSEDDDEVLKNNADLSVSEVQKRFFPDRSVQTIYSRRRALNIRSERVWSKEQKKNFMMVYKQGGLKALRECEEYGNIPISRLRDRVRKYKNDPELMGGC